MTDGKAFVEVLQNACKDISLALLQGGRKKSIALDQTHSHLRAAAIIIETLERERDAAINELSYWRQCSICARHVSEGGDCYGNHKCGNGNPEWEWRGVCAENGGTEHDGE